ncbi:DUF6221 family protein [Streptomyces diastaticus]|uniref:DUF6221 family protein n=1 Tax=Streptomyces diastaticus TaxID=1956 RepID=UPI0035E111FF
MTADLITFLRARLGEDEAVARAATAGPWVESGVGDHGWGVSFSALGSGVEADDSDQGRADAAHIARHDPARVLAEVEAKRRVVGECAYWNERMEAEAVNPPKFPQPGLDLGLLLDAMNPILRHLAAPYADHPDYREEWRP